MVNSSPLQRPSAGSHPIDPRALAWEETDTHGFWSKPLFADAPSGGTTSLMRVDAGAFAPSHTHDQLEEIMVIEGEFFDEDCTYRAGDYCVRAPGTPHTSGSHDGCTVLLIYRD